MLDEIVRRGQRIWKLTTARGISKSRAEELQAAERTVVANDFWYWLKHYAWFADPKNDDTKQLRKIPLLLWPKQRELLEFLESGYRNSEDRTVLKSREIGATWLACAWLYWTAAMSTERDGFTALVMSQKEDKVDDKTPNSILGKVRFQHSMQPDFLKPKIDNPKFKYFVVIGGGIIQGESTAAHAGRSGRYAVVLSDEWAAVPRNLQEPIVRAVESVPRTWWRISTPEGKGDDFHETVTFCQKYAPHKLMVIDWRADPRRTEAWYAAKLRGEGGKSGNLTWDQREQQYNCSFAAVSGLRIFKCDREKITYTDSDLDAIEPRARKLWPIYLPMDFGSGPSWTVCLFILVNFDLGREFSDGKGGMLRFPAMWLDRELVWQRTPVLDIGNQIMSARADYSDAAWHFGDPAGRNVESDQESWESNLNAAGVPIRCLDGAYNTETLRDESIIECQMMLDRGLFKVHAERCPLVLEALESWEWNVPKGMKLEAFNREYIKPMKDGWSHPMDAFRYAVSAALRMGVQEFRSMGAIQDLPMQPGGKVARMIAQQTNGRPHRGEDGPPADYDGMGF